MKKQSNITIKPTQKKRILTESFDRLAQRQGSEYLSKIVPTKNSNKVKQTIK